MPRISPIQLALGVGVGGAMVDVSAYVDFGAGISRTYGSTDDFRDPLPGSFTFTLNNQDGRFTPGSTTAYVTPVVEGMPVSWLLGTRLVSGSILSIAFPTSEEAWGYITITCDDMLGNASRVTLAGANVAESMVLSSPAYLYWPLSDAAGSGFAVEASGNQDARLVVNDSTSVTFGVAGVPVVGATQVTLNRGLGGIVMSTAYSRPISYTNGSFGVWSFWFTPHGDPASTSPHRMSVYSVGVTGGGPGLEFYVNSLAAGMELHAGGSVVSTPALADGVPHFFSTVITYVDSGFTTDAITYTLYMDGALIGSTTPAIGGWLLPVQVYQWQIFGIYCGGNASTASWQHISHTPHPFNETLAINTATSTETSLFTMLGQFSGNVTLGTLPTLSAQPVGPLTTTSVTLFQLMCDLVRTERGYLSTKTTGTLLAPVQTVVVRGRDRPTTPAATFDATNDLGGVPAFLRDITNTVSSVTVTGIGATSTVADTSAVSRVGASNASETIDNNQTSDLYTWGSDRIARGKNSNLRLQAITIDALTASAATVTAVLGLNPGDRIRLSGLPSAMLGFTSWDGWLIGATETHALAAHTFELYVAACLPTSAIFDTDYFAGGTSLALDYNGVVASYTTSINVYTADYLLSTTLGYQIKIDAEIMGVTAITGTNPQVVTITRGQAGTTATAHAPYSAVEINPTALYAF